MSLSDDVENELDRTLYLVTGACRFPVRSYVEWSAIVTSGKRVDVVAEEDL